MVLVGARTIAQSTVSFFIGELIIAADFEVGSENKEGLLQ
jgi:hypothetical protein